MWALAAARCRHEEAGAIGEDAAVYLGGDAPRAAQGKAAERRAVKRTAPEPASAGKQATNQCPGSLARRHWVDKQKAEGGQARLGAVTEVGERADGERRPQ